jgi:TetR/AcrR family transcriptional regulator, cholesterol catabolism regulator
VSRRSDDQVRDVTLDVVVDMLESGGYDAVRLQEVARRARLSLAKIYKLFPSRHELIVSAMERWMAANVYTEMAMPGPDESIGETQIRLLRTLFEPWERAPHMLKAYHRAVTGPGGERLEAQGWALVEPIARASFKDADPEQARDIETILPYVVYGLIGRFADGHIAITDILPIIERTITRLTGDTPPRARPSGSEPVDRSPAQADQDSPP